MFNTTNTSSQGLGLDNVSVYAGTATPVLIATLRDILQTDGSTPGQFNEGDVIRYETKIKNVGTGDAQNVQINIPPPSNTTLVPGSIKTSAVANDDKYGTSFNTTLNGSTVLVNDFGVPTPTAVLTYGPTANSATFAAGSAGTTDAGGTITLAVNGTFTYTPPTGFSGVDQFVYVTGNGNLPNNDAIVTITVAPDIIFTTTDVDPSCNGGSNGSITFNATGGAGSLTYSITGAAGTFQSSNSFTGLAAGTYNLVVKDATGYTKTGTITLNNPAAIVVSGTIPNLTYNTAMATATFTRTGGTGTITWSATGLPAGISINSSTGAVTGTPTQTGSFNAVITATDVNSCTGTRNVSFNVAPNLSADAYAAVVGNTQLVADAYSTPTTPYTTSATNILVNDASDAAISITAVTDATTTAGGRITIGTDGKFIYTPPAGATGADSYTYTGTSNGVSATATINFTIGNMVWYVDNSYSGSNGASTGRSNTPFTNVNTATTAAAINQVIYVHTGSGNTTGNAVLKSGQTLRGAGAALTVGALSITAGTRPTLSGNVALANNVIVDGFNMSTGTTTAITGSSATGVSVTINSITTNGAANAVTLTGTTGTVTISGGTQTNSTGATFNISGGSVNLTYSGGITQAANAAMVSVAGGHTGTLTFNTGTLSATNGTGLQFDNADGTYNFNGTTTLNGGDAGIDILNGSGGTFSFNSNTAITNPSGIAININASAANVTYTGTFSKTNNAVTGISVTNNTGGTIAFNGTGTKTLSTLTANAINLTTNTGATINFSGNNLLTTTTSGVGFNATGGGTISVAGTGNIINASSGGGGLHVVSTSISSTGLTFQSISSIGGSTTGIILDNTGTSVSNGGLTLTGDGFTTSLGGNSSGGTISNKSGSDLSRTTGIGIFLNNTKNVILRRITINGINQNFGIRGFLVNNFTLEYSTVIGTNGDNPNNNGLDDNGEGSIVFGNTQSATYNGITGSATITSCNLAGGRARNFTLVNTAGTLNRITFSGNNFGLNSAAVSPVANGSLFIEARNSGTIVNATVYSCTFTGSPGDQANFTGQQGSVMDVIFGGAGLGNTVSNSHSQNIIGGSNLTLASAGTMTFNVRSNTFRDANGSAVTLFKAAATIGTPSLSGVFDGNTIGVAGVANSGSSTGNGIFVSAAGTGTMAFTITNNQIHQVNGNSHIWADNTGGNFTANFSILNNTLTTPGGGWFAGIAITNGSPGSGDMINVCANIRNNVLNLSGGLGIIVGASGAGSGHTFNLPGYAGGANFTNIENFLLANNSGAFSTAAYADAPATAAAFTGSGTTCNTP